MDQVLYLGRNGTNSHYQRPVMFCILLDFISVNLHLTRPACSQPSIRVCNYEEHTCDSKVNFRHSYNPNATCRLTQIHKFCLFFAKRKAQHWMNKIHIKSESITRWKPGYKLCYHDIMCISINAFTVNVIIWYKTCTYITGQTRRLAILMHQELRYYTTLHIFCYS